MLTREVDEVDQDVATPAPAPPWWVPLAHDDLVSAPTPRRRTVAGLDERVVIALVIVAVVALATWVQLRPRTRPTPPHPVAFDVAVQPIVSFIEAETGKPFRHPVFVHFVASDKFESMSALHEGGETWSSSNVDDAFLVCTDGWGARAGSCSRIKAHTEPSVEAMFLRFLGADIALGAPVASPQLPWDPPISQRARSTTPQRRLHSLTGRDIVGLYDPKTASIYIRGTDLDAVRETVAHELVHAWQDQHGYLDGSDKDGIDAQYVYLAIMEGHAELIAGKYMDSLSPEQRSAAAEGEAKYGDEWVAKERSDPTPGGSAFAEDNEARTLALTLGFWPYDAGPRFLEARSKEEILHILEDRPASTWAIMNPTWDATGRGFRPKLGSVPGSRFTRRGFTIGPLLWSISLGRANQNNAFGTAWIGDSAVVYERRNDQKVCMFNRLEFIDGTGRTIGLNQLNGWAAQHHLAPEVSVVARGETQVDVNVCA